MLTGDENNSRLSHDAGCPSCGRDKAGGKPEAICQLFGHALQRQTKPSLVQYIERLWGYSRPLELPVAAFPRM